MMDRDGFFGPKVSQPAKAKPQWPTRHFWFSQMLMRSLQRCDGEPARSNCLRLAQRVPLARVARGAGNCSARVRHRIFARTASAFARTKSAGWAIAVWLWLAD